MPLVTSATGLAIVVVVFLTALHFALTYQRVPVPGDLGQGIWALATEGLYLLGKVAFLSVALAAGVQLVRYGLSAGRREHAA